MDTNTVGKPALTQEQIDEVFRKIEPYLKTGVSLNKACLSAGIAKSTAYDLYRENESFAEKVDTARNYCSILANSVFLKSLERINSIAGTRELTDGELKLLEWLIALPIFLHVSTPPESHTLTSQDQILVYHKLFVVST